MDTKFAFLSKLPKRKSRSGAGREFIAKLSKGLMLPIAMLPIAGLFLGIGATIATQGANNHIEGLIIFGNFLKLPGDVIFGALPVLFAIAIAIAFTKDAGAAGLSALVGFLVFSGIQASLIVPTNGGYNLLFYLPGSLGFKEYGLPSSLFGSVLGIQQLQTSVFGGFIVGFTVAFLYNKFKDIQMPAILGFFSGVRFIPVITFAALFPITIILLMVWPLIGMLFNIIGGALGSNMYGFNAFIFGYIERALVPLGLHHAFYSPLWYTSVGGLLDLKDSAIIGGIATGSTWLEVVKNLNPQYDLNITNYSGDQGVWSFVNSHLAGRTFSFNGISKVIQFSDFTTSTYTTSFNNLGLIGEINSAGVNIGQYMQGKYPFMMFALPAAAAAMVMAAPKENRKTAASLVVSAGATSFLTGITEPIEFTFLFLAPWLFWGFHAFFAALSFGIMSWVGLIFPSIAPHVGLTFSGGALDWVIYGAVQIPGGSNAWVALLIGIVYVPIYYFFFLWAIKKFNIGTPGRGDNTKLFTKSDYQNKNTNSSLSDKKLLAINVIQAYGGLKNIKNVDACITKLRIQVVSQDEVNREWLMQLGAVGVINPSAQSTYSIFGAKADLIKNQIIEIQSDINDNPSLEQELFSDVNQNIVKNAKDIDNNNLEELSTEHLIIYSPIEGKVINLDKIPDQTFSEKFVGEGIGIVTNTDEVYSPIFGEVELAFPGGHAYVIKSSGGTSIMVHVGIDSIGLLNEQNLSIFQPYVDTGYQVNVGDHLVRLESKTLNKLAKSNISPVLVLNESIKGREVKILVNNGMVKIGDPIFELIPVK